MTHTEKILIRSTLGTSSGSSKKHNKKRSCDNNVIKLMTKQNQLGTAI